MPKTCEALPDASMFRTAASVTDADDVKYTAALLPMLKPCGLYVSDEAPLPPQRMTARATVPALFNWMEPGKKTGAIVPLMISPPTAPPPLTIQVRLGALMVVPVLTARIKPAPGS